MDGSPPDLRGPDILNNHPPVADAGKDQAVEQSRAAGADVALDGSGSSDPDEHALTYTWTRSGSSATGGNPMITIRATDASGNAANAQAVVTVPHDQKKKWQARPVTGRSRTRAAKAARVLAQDR